MRLILSLILSVLVGAAMGGLLFGADMIGFYLILLMPLAVGALVGLATSFPAVPGRIPTFPLLVVALIGCAAAVVVYWGATYLQYREEFVKVAQENIAVGRDEALALLLNSSRRRTAPPASRRCSRCWPKKGCRSHAPAHRRPRQGFCCKAASPMPTGSARSC